MAVKIGDTLICIDDDSQNEDLGFSGIVLKGTVGLEVGEEYTVESIDASNVPKSRFKESNCIVNGKRCAKNEIWTKEEFENVKQRLTYGFVRGRNFWGRVAFGLFKLK